MCLYMGMGMVSAAGLDVVESGNFAVWCLVGWVRSGWSTFGLWSKFGLWSLGRHVRIPMETEEEEAFEVSASLGGGLVGSNFEHSN